MPSTARSHSVKILALASLITLSGLAMLLVVLPSGGASAHEAQAKDLRLAPPQASPMTWLPSHSDGFAQTAPAVLALAQYGGRLYAGISSDSPSPVLIWAFDDETGWGAFSSPGFGGPNTAVCCLAEFNGILYAGTSNANGSQVWSSGGIGWSHVADEGFGDRTNHSVQALLAFKGRLFAGTHNAQGAQIWAYDGLQFSQVVSGGLVTPDNVAVESLAVHNEQLYAGTRNAQGTQIWRSADGDHWEVVMEDGFGQGSNVAVVALASYRGGLFAAVENSLGAGGEIWYEDWSGWHLSVGNGFASPSQPADANNVGMTSLAVHNDVLYAGTRNDVYGTQIWLNDGFGWWPSTKTGLGVGEANRATRAMASYGGALWVGVENNAEGAQVWYGKPQLGLTVVSRDQAVAPPNSLHYDVQIVNTLGISLTGLQAFDTWESSGDCVYDPLDRTHLRWDIGEMGPGESREHRFSLLTHSWCQAQVVTNTVRLQGDNLAPMFGFADTTILEEPTPTVGPSPTPTSANPVIVTLQQGLDGYSGASSTYLSQNNPTRNYCLEPRIQVGANQRIVGLVRFELASIPRSADVVSATLHLYGLERAQGRDISIDIFAISRTVEACRANWNYSSSGEAWGAAGCNDATSDRRPNPEVSFVTSGTDCWYALDVTEAVRGWVDGSLPNNGLLLLGPGDSSEVHGLASVSHTQQTERPKLSIAYFPVSGPTETPTPTETRTPAPTHTPTATAVCPDPYEPNDGFSSAWDMGWGGHLESYLCSAQDMDYFYADIGTQPFNGFNIVLSNLPADYSLQVYDVAQGLIASSAQPGLVNESAAVQEQGVYIQVLGADGAHDATQPYHLDVIPVTLPTTTPTATLTPTPTTTRRWHLYLPLVMSSQATR